MSLASNPPTILDRMANSDEIAYVPLAFGYANYARSGFARRQLWFAPGPGTATSAGAPIVPSGTLGGAGLAVSSSTAHPEAACAYTAFTASGQVQRTTYAEGGGQPAHREAWTDRHLNDESGAFFASTLGALDEAYLRPRFDGFLGFQDVAGDLVHRYLRTGEGADRRARRARRVVPCEPRDDGGSGSMTMALEGIRVLDFTQMMMGPWATQFLGDMGADVVKIERPSVGEWERGLRAMGVLLDGQSPFFLAMNRNKRSVALNLKDPRAREIVLRLAGDSDLVVENFRPGVMARLGLGYDDIAEVNPAIVYVSGSGFGQTGPYVDRPGQDLLIQAISGLAAYGGRAGDPRRHRAARSWTPARRCCWRTPRWSVWSTDCARARASTST